MKPRGKGGLDVLDIVWMNDLVPMGHAITALGGGKAVQCGGTRVPGQQIVGFADLPDADIGGFHRKVEAARQVEQFLLACLQLNNVAVAFVQQVEAEENRHDHGETGDDAAARIEHETGDDDRQADQCAAHEKDDRAGPMATVALPISIEDFQVRMFPKSVR